MQKNKIFKFLIITLCVIVLGSDVAYANGTNTNDQGQQGNAQNANSSQSAWTGYEGVYAAVYIGNQKQGDVVVENSAKQSAKSNSKYETGGMEAKTESVITGNKGSGTYGSTRGDSNNNFTSVEFKDSLYHSGSHSSVSKEVLGINSIEDAYNILGAQAFGGMSLQQVKDNAANITVTMEPVAEIRYTDPATGQKTGVVGTVSSLKEWYEANGSEINSFGFHAVMGNEHASKAIQLYESAGCSSGMSAACDALFNNVLDEIRGLGMLWLKDFLEEECVPGSPACPNIPDTPNPDTCPTSPNVSLETNASANCSVSNYSYKNYRENSESYKGAIACEVLCEESYSVGMPSIPLVYAGQYFTVSNLNVTYNGSCNKYDYSYYYECEWNKIETEYNSKLSACYAREESEQASCLSSVDSWYDAEQLAYNTMKTNCQNLTPGSVSQGDSNAWNMDLGFGVKWPSNSNRYISIGTATNASETDATKYYDNGSNMATTPINLQNGNLNYTISMAGIFSSKFLERMGSGVQTSMSCPYSVVVRDNFDGPWCPPDTECGDPTTTFQMVKLKVEYRSIDLNNPFPGINGTGRKPGRNWVYNNAVETYITQNRGVEGEDVYSSKEPLYVIKLDSNNIRDIREYNDDHAYDDFTLSCTEGKGTECKSDFLRDKNLIVSGTCKDIGTVEEFYTCADKIVPVG